MADMISAPRDNDPATNNEMSAAPGNTMDYQQVESEGPDIGSSSAFIPAPSLASSRYNRQLLIPSISLPGHERIASSRLLIIGLGGLGSPAALYLAGAGVGTLGLMDDDMVELSNLHRQIVHSEASVREGLGKVESAVRACRALNSEIVVEGHKMRCDVTAGRGADLFEIVAAYDVVLDCTDNPATRYLISDVCVLLGKVLVSGAAQRLEGQLCLLNYPLTEKRRDDQESTEKEERGPCYRCVFPTPPSPEMVKGCGEIGILGPVVGTVGTLMASEALRCVVKGVEPGRKPCMLLYNAWSTDPRGMFRSIALRGRRKDCLACGEEQDLSERGKKTIGKKEVIDGHWDYLSFCGIAENVEVLTADERVQARDFLEMTSTPRPTKADETKSRWNDALVVDVREPHEIEMGPKLRGSVNIPFSRVLRKGGTIAELDAMLQQQKEKDAVIFVCQQGNDSQVAARKLLDFRKDGSNADKISRDRSEHRAIFIGDIVRGFAGIEQALR